MEIGLDDFQKMELVIGTIKEVEDHPNADKLYVLKIDIGTEVKQIVAGIKSGYEKSSLKGKRIVVVNNLESATIRGVESNGMLLAARTDSGPVILTSESNVPAGSQIG